MAVQFDPFTEEPQLHLPTPHSHLKLTPHRATDGPAVMAALNDPSVYMTLLRPFPYLQQHWDAYFPLRAAGSAAAIAELRRVEAWKRRGGIVVTAGERPWVGAGQPFPVMREVDAATGEERFLGEVSIRRADYREVKGEAERRRRREANDARAAGDPGIEWEVGFWLAPWAQGRGIMTVVLRTLLETFFVGYMNVQSVKGSYLEDNFGSKRVLEKCGFVYEGTTLDLVEINEKKIGVKGKKVSGIHMRWRP